MSSIRKTILGSWPMLVLIAVSLSSITQPAHAMTNAPQSHDEFCTMRQQQANYFIQLAQNSQNRLSFVNQGGLFNGGVCWWHSLFQRASIYLTIYHPDLPKPTETQAKALIHSIAAGKKVVEIPGYSNMYDFSADWQKDIQSKLEEWQLVDGFLKFAWIDGLSGGTTDDPTKILSYMNTYQSEVDQSHQIIWTMLQLAGISSHAALLIDVEQNQNFYQLFHIDSNFPGQTDEFDYRPGQNSLYSSNYGYFVTYPGRNSDLDGFKQAGDAYCSNRAHLDSHVPEVLYNGLE